MKKMLITVGILILLSIIWVVLRTLYIKNTVYTPKGPSFQTPEKRQTNGYPAQQLDAGADAARKSEIEKYDIALKQFYSTYNRSPEDLEELVTTELIKKVTPDMVTKQPPMYVANDTENGCRVEFILSDGSTIAAYCK